jgi:hypothetical protein
MSAKNYEAQTGWRHTGYEKKCACQRCGGEKLLVVHHKDRDKTNNCNHLNLETLCRACHAKEHSSEIAVAQRRPDVNERRGAAISKARTGKHYPKMHKVACDTWAGPGGARLRAHRSSAEFRAATSARMKVLMNDPVHMAKRKAMKEARHENS